MPQLAVTALANPVYLAGPTTDLANGVIYRSGAGQLSLGSLSTILDLVGSAAQGDILYRGAATWTRLGAGTNGQFLKTQGAGANPTWAAASSTNALLDGSAHSDTVAQGVTRGSLIYGNSTPAWNELVIGAANRLLGSDGTDVAWVQGDHGAALTGLADDDHTQYALLAGRSDGQTLLGHVASGTNAAANPLKLASQSTGNATPGSVVLQSSVAGSSGASAQTLFDHLTVQNGSTIWKNNAGTTYLTFTPNSNIFQSNTGISAEIDFGGYAWGFKNSMLSRYAQFAELFGFNGLSLASTTRLCWSSGTDARNAGDLFVTRKAAASIQLGIDSATPVAQTFGPCSGVGTDIAAGKFTIRPGQSTGSGTPGTLALQGTAAGASSSTAQTLADVLTITNSTTITLADAVNVVLNATTGTKWGTATTQKQAWYGATPVIQQSGIVDADGTLADITTKFNSLLTKLETYGLLAAA